MTIPIIQPNTPITAEDTAIMIATIAKKPSSFI